MSWPNALTAKLKPRCILAATFRSALSAQTRRPPKNPLAVGAPAPAKAATPKKKGRTFTAAQHKQQAELMKHYWAAN